MQKPPAIPRKPFRSRVYYGRDGEIVTAAPGAFGLRLAQAYCPSTDAIREMLLQIRRRRNWSQPAMAGVLGVPLHTLRKWEEGARNPSGAAKKLIWTVHALVFEPERLLQGLGYFITWGMVSGADKSNPLADSK